MRAHFISLAAAQAAAKSHNPIFPRQSWPGVFFDRAVLPLASVDKGTHACGPDWAAVCRVIVLDIRHANEDNDARRRFAP